MRFIDWLTLVLGNLNRRKARVGLTAVGVIIGTAAVVILVSLGIGLQKNASEQFSYMGDLTQIIVMPGYSEVFDPMTGPGITTVVNDSSLETFAAIPHVTSVIPVDYSYCGGLVRAGRLENYPNVIGIGTRDLSVMGLEALEGEITLQRGTAVIGYNIENGFWDPKQRPGQPPPTPPELVGQNVKIILTKYTNDGQMIERPMPVRVVGQLQEKLSDPDWTIYVPLEDVTAWNGWCNGKRINRDKDGYQTTFVRVDEVGNTIDVAQQIRDMGYQVSAAQDFVQGINSFYVILQVAFAGIGAISLLVAAIGIANTMAMAILERTREIGLMKAVGATNRDILSIFLGESALIGFLGGIGGVIIGWLGGQIITVLSLVYQAGQSQNPYGSGMPLEAITPPWLLVGTLAFATLIGLLAGIYPSLRAATLIPIIALKYE